MNGPDDNHFDRIWKRKLQKTHSTSYAVGDNLRVDKTLSVLGSGRRVLDIGCGTGVLLFQLKERFDEIYGIDISREAVMVARKNGVQASVVDFNLQPLPYQDEFFDIVTILSTLQYFIDPEKTLSECNRVLAPKGRLMLSVPNIRAIWRIGKLLFQGSFPRVSMDAEGYDGGTLHYFAFTDLKELLHKNGFNVLQAHGIFCIPKIVARASNTGIIGWAKREFFSAEVFINAIKI
jgi:methionine biosynthesis protein MetW